MKTLSIVLFNLFAIFFSRLTAQLDVRVWQTFNEDISSNVVRIETNVQRFVSELQLNHSRQYVLELQAEIASDINLIDSIFEKIQTFSTVNQLIESQRLRVNELIDELYSLRNGLELLYERYDSVDPSNNWQVFLRDITLAVYHLTSSTDYLLNEATKNHTVDQFVAIRVEALADIEHIQYLILQLESEYDKRNLSASDREFILDSIATLYSLRNDLELIDELLSRYGIADVWLTFHREIEMAIVHLNASTDHLVKEISNANISAIRQAELLQEVSLDLEHVDSLLMRVQSELFRVNHDESQRLFISDSIDSLYNVRNTLELLQERLFRANRSDSWSAFEREVSLAVVHMRSSTEYLVNETRVNHTSQQLKELKSQVLKDIDHIDDLIVLVESEMGYATLNSSQKWFVVESHETLVHLRNDLQLVFELLDWTAPLDDWPPFQRLIEFAVHHLNASTDFIAKQIAIKADHSRDDITGDIQHIDDLLRQVETFRQSSLNNPQRQEILLDSSEALKAIRVRLGLLKPVV